MNPTDQPQTSPLMLLGMHRSGTSFAANWLTEMGVHMGSECVGNGIGNRFGHFEDIDFVEFHARLLKRNGYNYLVGKQKLRSDHSDRRRAIELLGDRGHRSPSPWGWKDPRTCLFLPLWAEVGRRLNALCVYRDCGSVCDSLMRRQEKIIAERAKQSIPRQFVRWSRREYERRFQLRDGGGEWTTDRLARSWIRHNAEILRYAETQQNTDNVLVLSFENLLERGRSVAAWMSDRWGYQIEVRDPRDVYSDAHFKTCDQPLELAKEIRVEVDQIDAQLRAAEAKTLQRLQDL